MSREQKWSTFGERRRMGSNCRRDGSSATRSSASFAVVANSWFRRTWSNMCGGEAVNRIPNLATTGACQAARPAYEHQCPYEEPNVDSSRRTIVPSKSDGVGRSAVAWQAAAMISPTEL